MCLAIVASKNTDKYSDKLKEAIRNAAVTNTDGMGYTFKRASNNKIYIAKGFNTPDRLWKSLNKHKLKEEDELLIHLRIGNKGAKNTDMNHPFVVADNASDILQNFSYVDNPVLIHNGTLHSFAKTNSVYSDTFFFNLEFMSKPQLLDLLKNDTEFFKSTFSTLLGTNKLAFLFPDRDLLTIGSFTEDEGYLFSNQSYKNTKYTNIGGTEYYSEDEYDMWEYYRGQHTNRASGINLNKAIENSSKGLKSFDDIVVPIDNKLAFDEPNNGIKYRLYMGMWIPNNYIKGSQFDNVRFQPNEFNYTDFIFQCQVEDKDINLSKWSYYKIAQYDDINKEGLHCLLKQYTRADQQEFVYVSSNNIARIFSTTFSKLKDRQSDYEDYFRLVKEIDPSKNEVKRVIKALKQMSDSEKRDYRGVRRVSKYALELYLYNAAKTLYPDTWRSVISNRLLDLV